MPQNSIAYIQATAQLKGAGLLTLLQGEFSLSEIIEISDALLASPVLALEIDLESSHALEALAELRHRAGSQMLIGAGGIEFGYSFYRHLLANRNICAKIER